MTSIVPLIFALVKALSINEAVMGHVAAILIFIIPAYVMWTHARSTQKLAPEKSA